MVIVHEPLKYEKNFKNDSKEKQKNQIRDKKKKKENTGKYKRNKCYELIN